MASSSGDTIAMLPQPYVTIAATKLNDLRVAIDLGEAWENTDANSLMVTGVLVIRKSFADKYPEQVAKFLEEYQASADFANENVKETALLSDVYGLFPAAIAEKAIPECNTTCIVGADMRPAMEGYLRVLYEQNPKSVGGQLPGDDFYYKSK
jgi:NitT/TauT family transport system substrate-binding protein